MQDARESSILYRLKGEPEDRLRNLRLDTKEKILESPQDFLAKATESLLCAKFCPKHLIRIISLSSS